MKIRLICLLFFLIITIMKPSDSFIHANVFSSGYVCDSTPQTIVRGVLGQGITGYLQSGTTVAELGFIYVISSVPPTEVVDQYNVSYCISIFPNPAKDNLIVVIKGNNLLLTEENLSITDIFGEQVDISVIRRLIKKDYLEIEMNVTLLTKGVYIIKAGECVRKFLKV